MFMVYQLCDVIELYPVYMIKTKVAFLEGRLFSSQSGLFENFRLLLLAGKKPALQKSHLFLSCKQAIRDPGSGLNEGMSVKKDA